MNIALMTMPGTIKTMTGSMYSDDIGWNSRSRRFCGPNVMMPGRARGSVRSTVIGCERGAASTPAG